ncbi:(acyl-carrier-protein) S-malonyltransferase [Candidatus Scalindua japonica]|uniref:Malonyl CoA-acyl carrier protein transacylase n=1 Tax=Candidatus Scalindua japonica TaxID=1284222 RepID=A0A286TVH3_9BACT|nr:ACP S-malonyltransferase [Candidatus Scalindua japonica]GAX59888.1 (acyl-carrier-protein) S-malonyltransferase [Candidatus Scalindua japonica]
MTKIYVFPGQGSQAVGMGGELFDQFSELVKQADEVLGYSIKNLCLEDTDKKLGQTDHTQPALYIVNALTYLSKTGEANLRPDFVAGHSLGEYNALFAAGVFDFITGLKLVKKRGEIMVKATGGGMAAVIGMQPEKIKQVLKDASFETIDIANLNSPKQTVISGRKEDIDAVKAVFEEAGVKLFIPLKVSGAFHSRYMLDAQDEFADFLKNFAFQPVEIPVIANYTAAPYQNSEIVDNMTQQISNPVRWIETIQYLKMQPDTEFEEIGPGKVLTKLIGQIS